MNADLAEVADGGRGGAAPPPLLLATVATVVTSIVAFVRAPLREPLVLGALAASAGLAAHQIFDFLTFYPKVGGAWWLLLGVAAASALRTAQA